MKIHGDLFNAEFQQVSLGSVLQFFHVTMVLEDSSV